MVSDASDDGHEVSQTESCGELLAAAEASDVSVDMTLEQLMSALLLELGRRLGKILH